MTFHGFQPLALMPSGGYDIAAPGGLMTMAAPVPAVQGWGGQPAVPGEALRQQTAALLQHCYHWLEAAVGIVPETAELAPALITAVQQYQAQQYEASLAQVAAVVQAARQLRTVVPALPPL